MMIRSLLANGSVSTVEDDSFNIDDDDDWPAQTRCVMAVPVLAAKGRGATKAETTLTLQTKARNETRDAFMVLYQVPDWGKKTRSSSSNWSNDSNGRRYKFPVRVRSVLNSDDLLKA